MRPLNLVFFFFSENGVFTAAKERIRTEISEKIFSFPAQDIPGGKFYVGI